MQINVSKLAAQIYRTVPDKATIAAAPLPHATPAYRYR